jgi:hypothetical protein
VITDILFSWNVLTVTMTIWATFVSLVVAADVGPEMYRDWETHKRYKKNVALLETGILKNAKPAFDPDKTMQLGVFKIEKPAPAKRRHARAAA